MVMATQNPIEQEGTFRLPEAQMDRFLLRLSLGYPDAEQEKEMCQRVQLQHPIETLTAVTTAEQIVKCQRGVREIPVGPDVCDYLVALTRATREHAALRLGASPRGSLGLFRAAQSLAAIQGHRLRVQRARSSRDRTGAGASAAAAPRCAQGLRGCRCGD